MPKLSVIITAKDKENRLLKDLMMSISDQRFKDYEVDIVTEGDSESAKAIGVRRAKGEIICIMASDNYLTDPYFFEAHVGLLDKFPEYVGAFPWRYYYHPEDTALNRYFALMGCNDPIPFYLNKCDKVPYFTKFIPGFSSVQVPTIGDNGFFIRRNILMKADLDHYYHIDVCEDLRKMGYKNYLVTPLSIWHRTATDFWGFFKKRLKYADKFDVPQRRWKMVTKRDIPRLLFFIIATLTIVEPVWVSIKGYRAVKDKAWFLHLPVCWITLGVYGLWLLKRILKRSTYFLGKTNNGSQTLN